MSWLLDDNGDLAQSSPEDCSIPVADRFQSICQKVRACLFLQKGESLFFPDEGIDYSDDFYSNFRRRDEIDIRLRAKLEDIEGIDSVELSGFVFDEVNRFATYKWGIRIDGEYVSGEINA